MLRLASQWVQTLVTVLLVLAMMQLLLPEHRMRDYTRLVLGLVVIGAMLTPMLALLDPATWDVRVSEVFAPLQRGTGAVDGPSFPAADAAPWIARGVRLAQRAGDAVGARVRDVWESQVRSIALLVPGVEAVDVRSRWGPEGELDGLWVRVRPAAGASPAGGLAPPRAGSPDAALLSSRAAAGPGPAGDGGAERALEERVRAVLSDYFFVPPERVHVEVERRGVSP